MRQVIKALRGQFRPAFAILLALCCAVGMVQTGQIPDPLHQFLAFGAVGAWMLFAVAVNDIADEKVDRVNLARDDRRMLARGELRRGHLITVAASGAVVALAMAAGLGRFALVVVACGLTLAVAYSLPPFSLSGRGVATSVLLPLGYVGVPYLVGAAAADPVPNELSPVLLTGLYLGFLGRLALKDFRDEHGDRLFDKRTTLVRHGRTATCAFSAAFWVAGAVVVLMDRATSPALVAAVLVFVAVVLALLRDVAADSDGWRDIANISAIAIAGRALVAIVLADTILEIEGWAPGLRELAVLALAAVFLQSAWRARRFFLPTARPIPESARSTSPLPVADRVAEPDVCPGTATGRSAPWARASR